MEPTDRQKTAHVEGVVLCNKHRQGYAFLHATPTGWSECDVAHISKAGYFTEYEVKVSRSDFLADKHKVVKRQIGRSWRSEKLNKHTLLEQADALGPSRFFYVVPCGLIEPEEVPEWAGLLTVRLGGSLWSSLGRVKEAPRLHGEKFKDKRLLHLLRNTYFRETQRRLEDLKCID
jgi:hypothetical protein